jgi:hypothetical protein
MGFGMFVGAALGTILILLLRIGLTGLEKGMRRYIKFDPPKKPKRDQRYVRRRGRGRR